MKRLTPTNQEQRTPSICNKLNMNAVEQDPNEEKNRKQVDQLKEGDVSNLEYIRSLQAASPTSSQDQGSHIEFLRSIQAQKSPRRVAARTGPSSQEQSEDGTTSLTSWIHQQADVIIGDQFDVSSSGLSLPKVKRKRLLSGKGDMIEVYAPSGPLGIVIDTTPDGPMIHSIKATSPLINMVVAGDIVIGIDEVNTEAMSAATLTRIMAKRSQQPRRKISVIRLSS